MSHSHFWATSNLHESELGHLMRYIGTGGGYPGGRGEGTLLFIIYVCLFSIKSLFSAMGELIHRLQKWKCQSLGAKWVSQEVNLRCLQALSCSCLKNKLAYLKCKGGTYG